jgi:Arc/MetJ-type ribon-helix-helix transcriptional regulator
MPQHIPLSVVLSPIQLAWLDAQRQQGNLSRSAALRVALDRLIQQEQAQAPATNGQ